MLRIYLLSFVFQFTFSTVNRHLKISCGLDELSRDSVAMRFYIQLQNTGDDCEVECIPDKCCLEQGDEEDCDTLQMIGGCFLNVPAGESRTARLAAPLLNPFDRRGFCIVHLHSKLKGHGIFRDRITIPFDTSSDSVTPCPQPDQDPLNDCHPVNCDTHYNGHKPHYSRRLKRCLTIPPCNEDDLYDAKSNKCVAPISDKDIRRIKSLKRKKRRHKGTKKTKLKIDDELEQAEKALSKSVEEPEGYDKKKPMKCLIWNSTGALVLVIFLQCCLVVSLFIWIKRRCKCGKNSKNDKKVVNTFYNKNESMSTPLLSCTMTTCQYKSESSSNIDSKIKSYKASHKEQAKTSMSDDILARCLKRRDWTRPKSSEVIPEIKEVEYIHETMNKIVEKWTKTREFRECDIEQDVPNVTEKQSEHEVQCLDYEEKIHNVYTNMAAVPPSPSTGKGAQASLSRDSIDDFLSEHGLDFLGESRFTFSGTSNVSSGASSKNAHESLHKLGPASDPGETSDDLQLLHMSRASMFSSSNASLHTALKRTRSSM